MSAAVMTKQDKKSLSRDAMDKAVAEVKAGEAVTTLFGSAPATLFCMERTGTEKAGNVYARFRVMVYGAEVAEVVYEQRADGSIIREEL